MMFQGKTDHHSLEKLFYDESVGKSRLVHEAVLSELSNIHLFSFDPQTNDEAEVLRSISELKFVRAAQYNHYVQERVTPNDSQFGSQWHQIDPSDNDIDSDLAWDITTGGTTANGDDIVVCVIEPGGANYNHTDLAANHWVNEGEIPNNGVDDDGNGYVDDYDGWDPGTQSDNISTGGHGTAVSGMIGAVGNNGSGGAGVNWNVKIMQVEVGSLTESNVISSYAYPQTMRTLYNNSGGTEGAFVVATNASWGIDFANPVNYPVWCAYYDDLGAAGILNCGATANNNVNIDQVGDMPTGCGSDYMVSVTATNSSDQRTFSAYGATTIDLAAPGSSVFLPSGSSSYSNTSGTSFASPCVAGAIALVYSAPCGTLASLALTSPQTAADMVRSYILEGVDAVSSLQNETVTGGRLNVRNALDLALEACGPPPTCEPLGISAETKCSQPQSGSVIEAEITVDAVFESNLCSADQICYQIADEPIACIPLSDGNLSNTSSYTISGLPSDTEVTVYFSGGGVNSESLVITTEDCSSLVPGCTDPQALNFNPSANFDDGSCQYPCTDVTLSILTDCWGNEVSWELEDETGQIIASVAQGTYDDEQEYTFSECLAPGCYTFTIFDSFGDGLNGSFYSFCGVDGDYDMTAGDGTVLFEMGDPDYGSQTSHTFCIGGSGIPPCEDPYPVVQNLTSTVQGNGVLLEWNPILGSIGCQVQGGPLSGGSTSFTIPQSEANSFFVSNNSLEPGITYQWRVRCACSQNPLVVGSWSGYDEFTIPGAKSNPRNNTGIGESQKEITLIPNPTESQTTFLFQSKVETVAELFIVDITGKTVFKELVPLVIGENRDELDVSDFKPGLYLINLRIDNEVLRSKLIIN